MKRVASIFASLRPVRFLLVMVLSLSPVAAVAQLRVLPEESIPFTAFLRKADFDRRFPGENFASAGELEPGWYVRYEHLSLIYFFGPILLESTGEDYRAELESIVEDAVAERPSLTGYRIELRYEPSEPSADGEEGGEGDGGEDGAETPLPPQPKQRFGLFEMVRRLFGL